MHREGMDDSTDALVMKYVQLMMQKVFSVRAIVMALLFFHWNIFIITLTLTVTFSYMYRKSVDECADVLVIKYRYD